MDNKNNGSILIVGSGISGATMAERYANVIGKKVLIIEKRNHIGGNCFDHFDKNGVLVPKYGPHFFHTNYRDVWNYVNKFTEWRPYEHRVLSFVDGELVPVPVNIVTINKIFNIGLKSSKEAKDWLRNNVEVVRRPKNSEDSAVSRVGRILYEKMFKNYTKKQWDLFPSDLLPEVMNRIPVRTNFDDRYFSDKYQAMPVKGYTRLFDRMLDNKNIEVKLKTDFFKAKIELQNFDKIFFTGPIDKFFNYKFGKLQYRSLRFRYNFLNQDFFQERAQINYPNTEKFTRITEPKHATGQKRLGTTIIKEYPTWNGEPYYPVLSKKNQNLYKLYKKQEDKLNGKSIYFIGRLANYKYINMDQSFKNALDLFNKLEKC